MSIGQILESPAMRAVIEERDRALAQLETRGVSVVVPCYNQSEYLMRALRSVKAQTVQPLEVIVIDDGSTEQRPALRIICEKFGATLVRVTNRGLPNARNAGLMLARGEAFLPLDADDWIDPCFIEKTLPVLQNGADVVQVGLQEHGERVGTFWPGYDRPLSSVGERDLWQTNRLFYCSLIRTDLLRQVGGYNGRMVDGWEDWDLWIDLFRRNARFAGVSEILFHYHVKPGSMATRAETRRHEILQEMRRHHV